MGPKPSPETPTRFGTGLPVLYGLAVGLIVALICIFIAATIVAWTSVSEFKLPYITYTINVISVLIGSAAAAKRVGEKGWYYGSLTGCLYIVAIQIIGLLFLNSEFNMTMLVQIILLALIGAFGGVIGVNLRGRR